jgi:hypothetical protein
MLVMANVLNIDKKIAAQEAIMQEIQSHARPQA